MANQLQSNIEAIKEALRIARYYVESILNHTLFPSDAELYNYTELEYILAQGTGKEINTGVVIDSVQDTLEVTLLDDTGAQNWEYYFRWSNCQLARYGTNANKIRFTYYGAYPEYQTVDYNGKLTTFKFDNGHAWCNGTQYQTWSAHGTASTNRTTFRVFYHGDTQTNFKFYGAKVTRAGEVIHNWIPVLKDVDGTTRCGLWDTVTKQFSYTTASYSYKIKEV